MTKVRECWGVSRLVDGASFGRQYTSEGEAREHFERAVTRV